MNGLQFKVIPHKDQRYETVGDWWVDDDDVWQIRVSDMRWWRYHFLVFLHELIEMAWCVGNHVSEEEVTLFDIQFEQTRQPGDESEPGDAINAPYRTGHQLASAIERMVAFILKVNWEEYEWVIQRCGA